ncbi:MAG: DNA repair exonuclease [Acidobacteria bacterium]|nr:DNA repair exonuclease [Acidobacteriota bacterium]
MRPVRFLHTSDIHLDTSFSGAGLPSRLGDRKREAIRATFRRILEDARSLQADMVLIAGDLFELERITPDTVEFLRQQFAALDPVPVFIAPGNHDPCIAGSPYREEAWPGNVHIFREETFRSHELPDLGIRVTGFGFCRTHVPERFFRELPRLPGGLFNIVVAHGSDLGRIPAGKAAHGPFTIDEIAGKNAGYCALGHYHQQRQVGNPIDAAQVWYAGIPEGRGWDEEGECAYLKGEIENGSLKLQPIPCGQFPFRTLTVDCEGFSSREQIVEAVQRRDSEHDARTILRVRLLGSPDPRLDPSLSELTERLAEAVLHLEWADETSPAIDFDSLAAEDTLPGRFVKEMSRRIEEVTGEERAVLELARLYGTQSLLEREVRLR